MRIFFYEISRRVQLAAVTITENYIYISCFSFFFAIVFLVSLTTHASPDQSVRCNVREQIIRRAHRFTALPYTLTAAFIHAAHPRVIAYVMQGGLQSLQEAVHHSVPVVAIPFFGDQLFNARKILDAGIGLTLDIDAITESSIVRTLMEVIGNKT